MTKEIEENGVLIALFLGAEYCNDAPEDYPDGYYLLDDIDLHPHEWRFHSSWDWLMPVVKRIESITYPKYPNEFLYTVEMRHHSCTIEELGIEMCGFDSKFKAVYTAVIAFIKQFNKQKEV